MRNSAGTWLNVINHQLQGFSRASIGCLVSDNKCVYIYWFDKFGYVRRKRVMNSWNFIGTRMFMTIDYKPFSEFIKRCYLPWKLWDGP